MKKNELILKNTKYAFSLMEIMLALVAISVVLAAFSPVISKSIMETKNTAASYIVTNVSDCRKMTNQLCTLCDNKNRECLSCDIDDSLCGSDIDYKTCTCCPPGTMKIPVNNSGSYPVPVKPDDKTANGYICVTKYNVGDIVNGEGFGRDYITGAGVKLSLSNKSDVTIYNNPNAKQCWYGESNYHTANNSAAKPALPKQTNNPKIYPALDRTVCTWAAADAICKHINGSLIPQNTLGKLADIYSLNVNKYKTYDTSGLQLCNANEGPQTGTITSRCVKQCSTSQDNRSCPGSFVAEANPSNGNWQGCCRPGIIWSTSASNDKALYVFLGYNQNREDVIFSNLGGISKTLAGSVRCMIEPISP